MQLPQHTSFQPEFTISNFLKKLMVEGRLCYARCTDCGLKMIPPRPVCSRCLSSSLEWLDVPVEGKLMAFSKVHVSNETFEGFVPYIVGIGSFDDALNVPGIIKNSKIENLKI